MKTDFATQFKNENAGKWIWYSGGMGLDAALLNGNIEKTREEAVTKMANRDGVTFEEVDENYKHWYYIVPVEEIEDEYLNDYAAEYLDENFETKIN
jgi:hypothetical protein